MNALFRIIGALGIILVSVGIVKKARKTQDIFFILGGICLETYSISTRDMIFIILQIIFICAAGFDYLKTKR